jgi:hemerythrin-like domain-containing protein
MAMKRITTYALLGLVALIFFWIFLNRAPLKIRDHLFARLPNTEVSANEDLMREHGILNRLLLIYEEIERWLSANQVVNLKLLYDTATIIHTFIENYHEKLEEQFLFPRLEAAGKLTLLVQELRVQHATGRTITQKIRDLSSHQTPEKEHTALLKRFLSEFTHMYRAHASREDTEVFPEFHRITPEKEYAELGDLFEKKEQELLGENGFETTLSNVIVIEKALGINSLEHYMPDAGVLL